MDVLLGTYNISHDYATQRSKGMDPEGKVVLVIQPTDMISTCALGDRRLYMTSIC